MSEIQTELYTGKILVAEDEADIAKIIRFLLESKGHQVTLCPNGEEAFQIIPELKPDLLILDIKMPKMSGYALVKEIKKNHEYAGIPILMISGISKGSDKPDKFWQQGMGVDDYLTKPFDPKDLVKRVEILLRKKREGWLEKERDGTLDVIRQNGGMVSVKKEPNPTVQSDASTQEELTVKELVTPEDVVKFFVEAWNSQQFESEYRCLSQGLAFTDESEYVKRRRSYYAETSTREQHQQLVQKTNSVKISGTNARVEIVRLDIDNGKRKISRETYFLIQEDGNWKISAVKNGG